jgi:hypothetical protein
LIHNIDSILRGFLFIATDAWFFLCRHCIQGYFEFGSFLFEPRLIVTWGEYFPRSTIRYVLGIFIFQVKIYCIRHRNFVNLEFVLGWDFPTIAGQVNRLILFSLATICNQKYTYLMCCSCLWLFRSWITDKLSFNYVFTCKKSLFN